MTLVDVPLTDQLGQGIYNSAVELTTVLHLLC